MVIKHLTILDCAISDESMSLILEGIISQGKQLATFVFSNSDIGSHTFELLIKLLPYLNEIHISNLKTAAVVRTGGHRLLPGGQIAILSSTLSEIDLIN